MSVFSVDPADMPSVSRTWLAVGLVLTALAVALMGVTTKRWSPVADETQYLGYAYNLLEHGSYSLAGPGERLVPSAGREPGYPALIATVMMLDPSLSKVTTGCFKDGSNHCDPALYRSLQWLNSILYGLAALLVALTAFLMTGNIFATAVALGAMLLNVSALGVRYAIMSDYLALFLAALTAWATAAAFRRAHMRRYWLIAGMAAGGLVLTKALFLYPLLLVVAGWAVWSAIGVVGRTRNALRRGLSVYCVAAVVPILGWMTFNLQQTGHFGITDGDRTGAVLSVREIYNDMTAAEFATAFLWWTRGFGDNVARRYLPDTATRRHNDSEPDGFYQLGHSRYYTELDRRIRQQAMNADVVRSELTREMANRISSRPLTHAATTLPLFYRGIWIDEFALFSVPALSWLLVVWARRRDAAAWAVAACGLFSLWLYPLLSLNIPRYQLTSVPLLALATGIAAAVILARIRDARFQAGARAGP